MPWGEAGSGKTYFNAELGTAIVMRRPVFGRFPVTAEGEPGIAVFFAGEDADYFSQSRLTAIEQHHGRSLNDFVFVVEGPIPLDNANLLQEYRDELHRLQDV